MVGFICGLIVTLNVFAASDASYGPTTASDTIWSIAVKLRPNEEISIAQMALGIFYNNKDAFHNDNINALDEGKIIKIPDIDVIRNITENAANEEIIKQNRAWRAQKKTKLDKPQGIKTEGMDQEQISSPDKFLVMPSQAFSPINKQLQAGISSQTLGQLPINGASKEQQLIASQNNTNPIVATEDKEVTIKSLVERLVAAEEKNNVIQIQIDQLTQRVNSLEKNNGESGVIEPKKVRKHGSQDKISVSGGRYAGQLSYYLGQKLFVTIVAGSVIVLFFLLIYLIIPRRKNVVTGYPQNNSPTKEEEGYDPMAGNEGVAAKLNLARAYIDMGQESKAEVMLYEILSYGNNEEQVEAKQLLEEINVENSEIN